MIKYQQILHAQALLSHQSFRQAAKAEHITQPAFSRSIANLETTLEVELFNRHRGRITPTIYGEILKKNIALILKATSELEREIAIHRDLLVGELNIAMAPFPAEISGYKALGSLISEHPKIRCKVTSSNWDDVERQVMERKADIGFAELSKALKNKMILTEPIAQHQVVFFCRHGHPMLKKKQIVKSDFHGYPSVGVKLPERAIPFFNGILSPEKHSTEMLPSVMVQDLAFARQIVLRSDAFCLAAPVQIQRELKEKIFCIIPFHEPWMTLNYGVMYEKDRLISPVAKKYMDFLKITEEQIKKENLALLKQYLPA